MFLNTSTRRPSPRASPSSSPLEAQANPPSRRRCGHDASATTSSLSKSWEPHSYEHISAGGENETAKPSDQIAAQNKSVLSFWKTKRSNRCAETALKTKQICDPRSLRWKSYVFLHSDMIAWLYTAIWSLGIKQRFDRWDLHSDQIAGLCTAIWSLGFARRFDRWFSHMCVFSSVFVEI